MALLKYSGVVNPVLEVVFVINQSINQSLAINDCNTFALDNQTMH